MILIGGFSDVPSHLVKAIGCSKENESLPKVAPLLSRHFFIFLRSIFTQDHVNLANDTDILNSCSKRMEQGTSPITSYHFSKQSACLLRDTQLNGRDPDILSELEEVFTVIQPIPFILHVGTQAVVSGGMAYLR